MDSQQLKLKIKGLWTSANDLSSVPDGALNIADDISIDYESLAEPRRGFKVTAESEFPNDDIGVRLGEYQGVLIARHGATNLSWLDEVLGWQSLSTAVGNPDDDLARTRFVTANKNLYMTSASGIQKMDAYDVSPTFAGAPKALDGSATGSGITGFLPNGSIVAYRVVWGYRDLNNNLILGAPSQRIRYNNASGTAQNVALDFTIPQGITTAWFYQVYRAAYTTSPTEPSDEMNLVYEANPTSGQITAKVVTVTDTTPEDLRNGPTLYTSPSQEGALNANNPPPFAWDMCSYRGVMIYANVIGKQNKVITVLAVGGSGLVSGDVLTIGGVAFTADSSENTSTGHFKVFSGGTPSQNVADTCNSLVKVVNRYATNTAFYAYYISAVNELPGKILFEERDFGGNAFAFTASAHGTAYNPTLPTSGTTVESMADVNQNGLYYSKTNQPEAVPPTALDFAGDASYPIYRVLPLRDSVLIFKTDGIYRITGTDRSSFNISPLDTTTNLIAPDTAQVLGDTVYGLSDQGGISVGDVGTEVKTVPIQSTIINLYGLAQDNVKFLSFGVAYQTDRKYIMFLPDVSSTYPVQAYVFNFFTKTWVRWRRDQVCGFVRPSNNRLYLCSATSNVVNEERKTYTLRDYADESTENTIVSFSGVDIVLTDLTDVEVGDVVFQSDNVYSTIIAIDTDTLAVEVEDVIDWTLGACEILQAFTSDMEWTVATGGNPGTLKQFPELLMPFRTARFAFGTLSFKSDLSNSYESRVFEGSPTSAWGQFPWGSGAWGGDVVGFPVRTYIPPEKQICSQLTVRLRIRFGFGAWKLDGQSLPNNQISTDVSR